MSIDGYINRQGSTEHKAMVIEESNERCTFFQKRWRIISGSWYATIGYKNIHETATVTHVSDDAAFRFLIQTVNFNSLSWSSWLKPKYAVVHFYVPRRFVSFHFHHEHRTFFRCYHLCHPLTAIFRFFQAQKTNITARVRCSTCWDEACGINCKQKQKNAYSVGYTVSALSFGALAPLAAVDAGKAIFNHIKAQRLLHKFQRKYAVKQA